MSGDLHRLTEHLHTLDLLLELQIGYLNGVAYFHLAREDRACHDGALAFDLEAVVYGELEWLVFRRLSIWDRDVQEDSVYQSLYSK